MTRVLAEFLGVSGPSFHLSLRQLEAGAGMPSHDIRLSTEILHGTQAKLHQLGLDKHDTTGEELYTTLGTRLKQDEQRFAAALRAGSPKSDDLIAHVALALEREIAGQQCFALKSTAAKKLLKANVPKKAMKALGYRSADSMLKHESAASLYAAASLLEGDIWTKKMLAAYGKLNSSAFESRKVAIEHPTSKRWEKLAETVVAKRRHNIVSFKELGVVVLLPLPSQKPELVTLTTAALTLHAVNDIYAASTYLKLHLVQPNFGEILKQAIVDEPKLSATLLDQPISWNVVQRYYARLSEGLKDVRSDVFEPVLHMEDFVWHGVEQVLARIDPALAFWEGTGHLAMLHGGQPTSCNLTDQLLSHCNELPHVSRVVQYFRHELTQELSLRYVNYQRLEQSITSQFQKQFQTEPVPVVG